MESIIKWKKGNPKKHCTCIVTVKNHKGKIYTTTDSWISYMCEWNLHTYKNGFEVISWCPISEIKPSKE